MSVSAKSPTRSLGVVDQSICRRAENRGNAAEKSMAFACVPHRLSEPSVSWLLLLDPVCFGWAGACNEDGLGCRYVESCGQSRYTITKHVIDHRDLPCLLVQTSLLGEDQTFLETRKSFAFCSPHLETGREVN
ncbi:hypothetical protein JAO29_14870 [Edaphobacter sp. HDX4]|uniref:hypothetical protein n=1 Tax=Edaphobacter sp. HDX4 TaxID=2794064 RepID=UPI002FE526D1